MGCWYATREAPGNTHGAGLVFAVTGRQTRRQIVLLTQTTGFHFFAAGAMSIKRKAVEWATVIGGLVLWVLGTIATVSEIVADYGVD